MYNNEDCILIFNKNDILLKYTFAISYICIIFTCNMVMNRLTDIVGDQNA